MANSTSSVAEAADLESFLAAPAMLTLEDRLAIVDQAIILLEGFYAHLPLKRAMHAVEPLQRLRLLRRHVDVPGGDMRFHAEMTSIFTSVRDLHTNYLLPQPFSDVEAWLPFMVECCFEDGECHYLITNIRGSMPEGFEIGVTVTHWNAVPIARAVANAADRHAGSNPAARFSNGLAGLTTRPLILVPPPDEDWVTVSFIGLDGAAREARFEWQAWGVPASTPAAESASVAQSARRGIDIETAAIQRARQRLFAPQVGEARQALAAAGAGAVDLVHGTQSTMPEIFRAIEVETSFGTFGYIRIWSFDDVDSRFGDNFVAAFVSEFVRLLEQMPAEGLIIDVRDNGGGYINAGERILQTLTPRSIEPERAQFINTPLTQRLVDAHPSGSELDLSLWEKSIARAVETGAIFSSSFPLTDPWECNDIGQRYYGPVVLVTNARCYSTTDIFAAGFQDHRIGKVLGVDSNTGAGGANVWTHDYLVDACGPDSPLRPLPQGVGMRVAIRRTLRVRDEAGTELEDLGVTPNQLYSMSRRDLLEGNVDLIEKAAEILHQMDRFGLEAEIERTGEGLRIDLVTSNLDRLDVTLNGRPTDSRDIADGPASIDLATSAAEGSVLLLGYRENQLSATRRIDF
ncbi:MAG: S41 family peptidase [Allosphingosinicella sp.]